MRVRMVVVVVLVVVVLAGRRAVSTATPRMAHHSSGFSVALAATMRPSASATRKDSTRSLWMPKAREV